MARRSASRVIAVAAGILLAFPLVLSCAPQPGLGSPSPGQAQSSAPSSTSARASSASTAPATAVYQQNGPSVVNITSMAVSPSQSGGGLQPQGIGSGWMYDQAGHIVTNNHVVAEAEALVVTFSNGTTTSATLTGRDPENDLAVIQVDVTGKTSGGQPISSLIKPVTLANPADVVVGQVAIAIGSPLGLAQTVTQGIVSALRPPEDPTNAQNELGFMGGSLQTDTDINPGNSGGPLFNADGLLIGVNSAGLAPSGSSIGLNFAIPVSTVQRVVPSLIANGCYAHAFVGVTGIPLSVMPPALKTQAGIPLNQQGVLVQSATLGAAKAGINAGDQTMGSGQTQINTGGDVITAIDNQPIASGYEMRTYVENNKKPGDTVTLTVLRGPTYKTTQNIQVTLTGRPGEGVTCRR